MKLPRILGKSDAPAPPDEADRRRFEEKLESARRRMIHDDLKGRGIKDARVLDAMAKVPRHRFVKPAHLAQAYDDHPLDIGKGQTISQPYIVGRMTELANTQPGDRVLEIGAGSGYQTAVLMEVGAFVYAVEIVPDLAAGLNRRLKALGYDRFEISCHDGHTGWPEQAPFDVILIAAAASELPRALYDQLALSGRMVAPVGKGTSQVLNLWTRHEDRITREEIIPVRFVPMIGG